MKVEIAKLRQGGIMQYPRIDAEVRGSVTENNPAAVQEQIYAELGKQLAVESASATLKVAAVSGAIETVAECRRLRTRQCKLRGQRLCRAERR